jgi:hypothetical protein
VIYLVPIVNTRQFVDDPGVISRADHRLGKSAHRVFSGFSDAYGVLSTLFGIRAKTDFCLAVVKTVGELSNTSGKEFGIPVRPETLPNHLRILVENYMLIFPASDLIYEVTGKTPFHQSLESPPTVEAQRATTNGTTIQNNCSHLKSIA